MCQGYQKIVCRKRVNLNGISNAHGVGVPHGIMIRWRIGDRVTLRHSLGRWRIVSLAAGTAWLEGRDSFALLFSSLSPCGTVGVRTQELILDHSLQGVIQ